MRDDEGANGARRNRPQHVQGECREESSHPVHHESLEQFNLQADQTVSDFKPEFTA
jgi:hypothetical protein